jgi:hypothetical protein
MKTKGQHLVAYSRRRETPLLEPVPFSWVFLNQSPVDDLEITQPSNERWRKHLSNKALIFISESARERS